MNEKRLISFLAALAMLSAGACSKHKDAAGETYPTLATATKGSVVQTVSATGTIEPEEIVDIGAQVSGKILHFGKGLGGEELDYCSIVTNGMLLAKIDDVTYVADLNVARAQLKRSEASVIVSQATLRDAEVRLEKAKRDWERAQRLGVGLVLSQTEYDDAKTDFDTAEVAVSMAKAQLMQAEAGVVEAQAGVEKAERNLSYCDIVSSVDGVVIDRRVNVGQTVVSSMSASSLFLVASDLKKVQIWVAVNEADIGSIKEGGGVTFTVDTFPGRTFRGVVRRIRLNATITSNVVTYTVEIDTDNSDGALLPFLTANVLFETARADDGLVIPSKALRFAPDGKSDGKSVFVMPADGRMRKVEVEVLLDNGLDASVRGAGLANGDKVVTGIVRRPSGSGKVSGGGQGGASDGESASPFMPKMPKPPKNRGGGGPPP
ncbi:MAG: efflux RND transporter periplasmic adaptor subunit [Kiritimatiellae bacterium]|nr:efflux RND transporter periplasmic adaptor subunit [Kiritimatiellia bacterium]